MYGTPVKSCLMLPAYLTLSLPKSLSSSSGNLPVGSNSVRFVNNIIDVLGEEASHEEYVTFKLLYRSGVNGRGQEINVISSIELYFIFETPLHSVWQTHLLLGNDTFDVFVKEKIKTLTIQIAKIDPRYIIQKINGKLVFFFISFILEKSFDEISKWSLRKIELVQPNNISKKQLEISLHIIN